MKKIALFVLSFGLICISVSAQEKTDNQETQKKSSSEAWKSIGQDGEKLLKAGIPCKGLLQTPGILADALLVVEMIGRRKLLGKALELLQRDKGFFHGIPPA